MSELAVSFLVAFAILFVYSNYLFIDSVFIKNGEAFTTRRIQLAFALALTAVFVRLNINLVSTLAYFSMLVIYVMRISKKIAAKLPSHVLVTHSHELGYYLNLYWNYFGKPALRLFVVVVPVVILIFLFSRVYNTPYL